MTRTDAAEPDLLSLGGCRFVLAALSRSLRLLLSRPRLLLLAAASVLVTCLVFSGLLIVGFWGYNAAVSHYLAFLASWGVWGAALRVAMNFSFLLGYLVIMYFTFAQVNGIVCLPFLDLISERVEILVTGKSDAVPFLVGLWSGLKSSLVGLLRKLLVLAVCLPLLFVPVVGAALLFLIGAWQQPFDFIDFPMGRRGWRYQEKREFVAGLGRRRRLSFGTVIQAALLVPVINVLIFPLATVAGTLTFISLQAAAAQEEAPPVP